MKIHIRGRQFLLSLIALILLNALAHAQDFTPDLADQLNQQFLLRSETMSKSTNQFNAFLPNAQPISESQWSVANFTSQYVFGYTHSYLNGSVTKKNGGSLTYLIQAPDNFMLLPSLGVGSSRIESISGSDTADSLSINPSLQVGYNVTQGILPGKLTPFGKVGYTVADNDSAVGVKPSFTEMSGWALGCGLNYSYAIENSKTNIQIILAPAYNYSQSETVNVPLGTTTSTDQGNISTKLGLQYSLSPNWGVSTYGTWLRNINFTTAPGQVETHQDWARFGTDLIYNWKKISLDVGYAYDAFNSSYYSHTATLQLKYVF